MKRLIRFISISLCLIVALSSCDDYINEYETRNDEYTVYYYVTYSTIYEFHNIAYVSFTNFFDDDFKYTGKPRQILKSIDGTNDCIKASRVPKGAHIEFSTFVDVQEALPNTKVEISIEISKGSEITFIEVAKAEADCPLKGNPLTISFDIPA